MCVINTTVFKLFVCRFFATKRVICYTSIKMSKIVDLLQHVYVISTTVTELSICRFFASKVYYFYLLYATKIFYLVVLFTSLTKAK